MGADWMFNCLSSPIEACYDALDTLFRDALNGDTEYAIWLHAR